MGTEVLRPQDCLIRSSIPSFRNPKPNRSSRKRREGSPKPKPQKLVMGQVTILKRGESLPLLVVDEDDSKKKKTASSAILTRTDPLLFGPGRIGPDPELMPKQIKLVSGKPVDDDVGYAGSVCHMSPSPRSLPLPSFWKKKEDEATNNLRRLLRLD